jgi:hypothetical protein
MEHRTDVTRILSRIVGPYLLVAGVATALRRDELPKVIAALGADPGLTFVTGALILLVGLTMIVFHQRWRAPAQIALSLMAWGISLKGAALLAAPDSSMALAARLTGEPRTVAIVGGAAAVVGVWLCLIGYARKVFTF